MKLGTAGLGKIGASITARAVRSWLLDLTAKVLRENPGLEGIQGVVADSGEGRWTVADAIFWRRCATNSADKR